MKECKDCGLEFRGSWTFTFCPECGKGLVDVAEK